MKYQFTSADKGGYYETAIDNDGITHYGKWVTNQHDNYFDDGFGEEFAITQQNLGDWSAIDEKK